MNTEKFNIDYLEPLLENLDKENKICFLTGDFNINLLNIETKPSVSDCYDQLSSHYFAPYILQPTRITEHSKTLIDNIFLNSLEFSTYSGNLTSQFSDHLLQFVILFCYSIISKENYLYLNKTFMKEAKNFLIKMNLDKIC